MFAISVFCCADGVGLVDIRAANWKFKYANEAFGRAFNEKVSDYVGQGLWDKFETLRLVWTLSPPPPPHLSVCF